MIARFAQLFLPLFMFASLVNAQAVGDRRSITTTGNATVKVIPDLAEVHFTIETLDADLANAKRLNDESATAQIAALTQTGIDSKDIQTDRATSEKVFVESEDRRSRIFNGYRVERSYVVVLRNIAHLDGVLDRLLADNNIDRIHFEYASSKADEHKNSARQEAARKAKEIATSIAAELQCGLGLTLRIDATAGQTLNYYGHIFGAGDRINSDDSETMIGQIEYSANVTATFELQ